MLRRWSADASADPKSRDESGLEAKEFQTLRENIAARVPTFRNELQEFLQTNPDVYIRRGYYRNIRVGNVDQLRQLFERDGRDFLEAAVRNDSLYAAQPKGVRAAFRQLIDRDIKDMKYEDRQMLRANWNNRATFLFGTNPALYPDPAAWQDEEEQSMDLRSIDRGWAAEF